MSTSNSDSSLDAIAIIGMACRFPGANTPREFWANLCAGLETITHFRNEELLASGVAPALLDRPDYVKARGCVEHADCFDAGFFGMSPREAEMLDPQHRIFLECAWEALEDGGVDPERVDGSVAVFAGVGMNVYLLRNVLPRADLATGGDFYEIMLGNDKDFVSTRVSYKLNLTGPSVSLNTACSTSLVNVHQASQCLLNYQCDLAIAGGATLLNPPAAGYLYQEGGICSPDGHCRPFDALARGTVPSSGAGAVLLKRLGEAQRDGDRIYAVIHGSAINNDGANKVGFTAPSVEGQRAVIADALAMAEVDPGSVTYVEAHGTATPLGDPIELAALGMAFAGAADNSIALGSVKSNLGHMDTAAGVAGLMKTALALYHEVIPPSLHFETPNVHTNLGKGPFVVNTTLRPWPRTAKPRFAGVSSFGIGGTNAHAILAEAPLPVATSVSPRAQVLVVSAHSAAALEAQRRTLASALSSDMDVDLADVAFTLATGRKVFAYRSSIAATDVAMAVERLTSPGAAVRVDGKGPPPVLFLLPGQGVQYPGMAAGLYRCEAAFRDVVDAGLAVLEPSLVDGVRAMLLDADSPPTACTAIVQPALFIVEVALTTLWQGWGVRPRALLGHSVGELAAASVAGVMTFSDGCRAVVARGALMQASGPGGMLAVLQSAAACARWVDDVVVLAAENGPESCVLSGPRAELEARAAAMATAGVPARWLAAEQAFHSPLMATAAAAFTRVMAAVPLRPPSIPFVSNLTGTWITDEQATSPTYWADQLRHTVRFAPGLQALTARHADAVLLEVGPGQTLIKLAGSQRERCRSRIHSLAGVADEQRSGLGLPEAVGRLWTEGVDLSWSAYFGDEVRRKCSIATYPFARDRYWLDPVKAPLAAAAAAAPAPLRKARADWFQVPTWRRTALPERRGADVCQGESVLLLGGNDAILGQLAAWLNEVRDLTIVRFSERLCLDATTTLEIRPGNGGDMQALLASLDAAGRLPDIVIHLDGLSRPDGGGLSRATVDASLRRTFLCLLHLAQGLGGDPQPRRLMVLTAGGLPVTGAETISPIASLGLGAVQVIPAEFAHLTCQYLDLDFTGQLTGPHGDAIFAELAPASPEPVVAYRNGHRWTPGLAPLPLAERRDQALPVKAGGTYLITGGLGGLGLLMAEWLAACAPVNLALVSRTVFAEGDTAADTAAAVKAAADRHTATMAYLEQAAVSYEAAFGIRQVADYAGLAEQLRKLCGLFCLRYFAGSGALPGAGESGEMAAVVAGLRIVPKFKKFFDLLLGVLVTEGLVELDGGRMRCRRQPPTDAELMTLRDRFVVAYPGFAPLVEMLAHCVDHYEAALSGDIEAIGVLYPGGERNLIAELGQKIVEHTNHRIYYRLLKDLVDRTVAAAAGRRVRILEFGGGSGVLTGLITPDLAGCNVEYCFTDLGKSFVMNVERLAAERGIDFMTFKQFDVTQDPAAQGIDLHSFDIVFGLDVVHATRNMADSVAQLRRLLAPGGLLCLVESNDVPSWYHLIWGLAEGWWYFEDREVRPGGTPLLSPDDWEAFMASQSFAEVTVLPGAAMLRRTTDCSLIVAREAIEAKGAIAPYTGATRFASAAERDRVRRERLNAIRRSGSTVALCAGDVGDEPAMRQIVADLKARFGGINGVVHAAGSESRGGIEIQTDERAMGELAPKIFGACVLKALLPPRELDFQLLFSSMNALTGGAGNIAYATANLFLDMLAHRQRMIDGAPVTSINWDRWQGIGQAVALEDRLRAQQNLDLQGGIEALEGIEAVRRILADGRAAQVLVSPSAIIPSASRVPLDGGATAATLAGTLHARPDLVCAYVEPRTQMERQISAVWRDVLGIDRVGALDNFNDLGGDSLIAIRVVSRLREALQMGIEVRSLFENATVEEFAACLDTLQWADDGRTDGTAAGAELEKGIV